LIGITAEAQRAQRAQRKIKSIHRKGAKDAKKEIINVKKTRSSPCKRESIQN
jgi:hypothetical protein